MPCNNMGKKSENRLHSIKFSTKKFALSYVTQGIIKVESFWMKLIFIVFVKPKTDMAIGVKKYVPHLLSHPDLVTLQNHETPNTAVPRALLFAPQTHEAHRTCWAAWTWCSTELLKWEKRRCPRCCRFKKTSPKPTKLLLIDAFIELSVHFKWIHSIPASSILKGRWSNCYQNS